MVSACDQEDRAAGYIDTPEIGSPKFYSYARTWDDALQVCVQDEAQLGVINFKEEETVSKCTLTLL